MLSLTRLGPDPASDPRPPLLIVHGLFGSARNWGAVSRRIAESRPVAAVDMRNHGDSFHAPRNDYEAMADDLAEVIAELGGTADVLGHSMGGKAAMVLALTRPELVSRLIVADIAPVAYDHSQLRYIHAMKGLDLTGLSSRSEADARLAETLDEPGVRAFLLQSLDLRADPTAWKLNLDVLEAEMDTITGWPGTEGRFDGPSLFLSGEKSNYVTAEGRIKIEAQFPKARFETVEGAGHWVHAEKPREVQAAVETFLSESDPA
ncbi:alpha/beta fold hydrolase [Roseicyclus sp. F158]|uniref:Alpha/beta fold hydrolase n=1 Tax=Tropicimonas omnivorans TaxID=3075590 RepID=A0ABU3DKM0_9RHOB|nr:alpha/beta fold hydrolase [Roseicyclus sp. F158]MDT0684262.1 alpha/beta fold hydrolase [Roseicyclus sp. F158]